jgi:hypothetical protein
MRQHFSNQGLEARQNGILLALLGGQMLEAALGELYPAGAWLGELDESVEGLAAFVRWKACDDQFLVDEVEGVAPFGWPGVRDGLDVEFCVGWGVGWEGSWGDVGTD